MRIRGKKQPLSSAGLHALRDEYTRAIEPPRALIAEELGRLGWKEADLATRPKSDPAKLQIAARLRKETTLSIRQIAECLHLGTPRSASVRLHTVMRGTAPAGSVQPCLGI